MAYLRSYTVRDLRRKMYEKVLKLPLSYFTDARKGDLMTRISNDVQEIEVSVMPSNAFPIQCTFSFCNIPFGNQLRLSIYALLLLLSVAGLLAG